MSSISDRMSNQIEDVVLIRPFHKWGEERYPRTVRLKTSEIVRI